MDFGVQVYAKPPPPLQARSQVRALLQEAALRLLRVRQMCLLFPVSVCDQSRPVSDTSISLHDTVHPFTHMSPEGGLKY